jgi:hypothetical protein
VPAATQYIQWARTIDDTTVTKLHTQLRLGDAFDGHDWPLYLPNRTAQRHQPV